MRKSRVTIVSVIILLAVSIFCYGYGRVNHKYPKAEFEAVNMNEPIETEGLQFTVKNAHMYTGDELKQLKDFPEEDIYTKEMHLITLDVELKNVSGEKKTVEAAYRRIERLGWTGGVDLNTYMYFNQDNPRTVLELDNNETQSYTLDFPLVPNSFTEKDWKHIKDEEYQYVLSLYPVKKVIKFRVNE